MPSPYFPFMSLSFFSSRLVRPWKKKKKKPDRRLGESLSRFFNNVFRCFHWTNGVSTVVHACPLSSWGDCYRVGEQNAGQADENHWNGKTKIRKDLKEKFVWAKLELGPFSNTRQLKRQLVNYEKKINIWTMAGTWTGNRTIKIWCQDPEFDF